MGLLEQLEHERARVIMQLQRLTRERIVLTEQITRLRSGASPEIVCATLQAAFGVRLDVHLLASQGEASDGAARPEENVRGSLFPPGPRV